MAVVVLALALATGAASAIFSLMDTVFMAKLPGCDHPERLVSLWRTTGGQGFDTFSFLNYQDLLNESESFASLAAYHSLFLSISSNQSPRRVQGALVTGNYFQVLGARTFLGRPLTEGDDQNGVVPVTVVSYALWQELGGNPSLVGTDILVNGKPVLVVGVAARDFRGSNLSERLDLWLPLRLQALAMPAFAMDDNRMFADRQMSWLYLFGRLKPAVRPEQAQAEVNLTMERLRTAFPRDNERTGAIVSPTVALDPDVRGDWLRFCGLLMGAVIILLLLACANLGNFLLTRASQRSHQTALRFALGASRADIITQSLTETMMLAFAGTGIGLLISSFMAKAVLDWLPESQRLFLPFHFNVHLACFALLVALLTGTLLGVLPAARLAKAEIATALKTGTHQSFSRRNQTQHILAIVQVSLCLVLLTASGLLAKTLRSYARADLGFDGRDLKMMTLDPAMQSYSVKQTYRFEQKLFSSLSSLPEFKSVTLSRVAPLSSTGWGVQVQVPGREQASLAYNVVAPGYFNVIGIPIRSGREFSESDNVAARPVVIVNESAARKLWAGDALGKELRVGNEGILREVIGIVGDSKYRSVLERHRPFMYLPMWQQHPSPNAAFTVQVRTQAPVAGAFHAVERAVHMFDPEMPVFDPRTLTEQLDESIWQQRLAAIMITAFAAMALVVGLLGVYSILAYSVAGRRTEIGIRMALGARRIDVVRMVLVQGLTLSAIGIAFGGPATLLTVPALGKYLYGVQSRDVSTLLSACLLILLTGLAASYFPARSAAVVEPMAALRQD